MGSGVLLQSLNLNQDWSCSHVDHSRLNLRFSQHASPSQQHPLVRNRLEIQTLRAGALRSVAEHFPGMWESLGFISSHVQKKINKKKMQIPGASLPSPSLSE